MQKIKKQNLILAGIFILISCFFFYLYSNKVITNEKIPNNSVIDLRQIQATLIIENNKYSTEISEKATVYELMEKLRKENKINFQSKTFSGMGELVEEINGIRNSGEKNWIYYVNNKKATIGVSNYKINSGDIVSWKYEKSI